MMRTCAFCAASATRGSLTFSAPTRGLDAARRLDIASARSSATRMVIGCSIGPSTAICWRNTSTSMSGDASTTLSRLRTEFLPASRNCRSDSIVSHPPMLWATTARRPMRGLLARLVRRSARWSREKVAASLSAAYTHIIAREHLDIGEANVVPFSRRVRLVESRATF